MMELVHLHAEGMIVKALATLLIVWRFDQVSNEILFKLWLKHLHMQQVCFVHRVHELGDPGQEPLLAAKGKTFLASLVVLIGDSHLGPLVPSMLEETFRSKVMFT